MITVTRRGASKDCGSLNTIAGNCPCQTDKQNVLAKQIDFLENKLRIHCVFLPKVFEQRAREQISQIRNNWLDIRKDTCALEYATVLITVYNVVLRLTVEVFIGFNCLMMPFGLQPGILFFFHFLFLYSATDRIFRRGLALCKYTHLLG